MSYPTTLNTNEVKDAAGVEQEFGRIGSEGRQLTFALLSEVPSRPHRINIKHAESGSGISLRRRSLVRVDKSIVGQVDTTKIETVSAYIVVDAPIGNMTTTTEIANTVANLVSNVASKGATTTILYDGTGYGAEALIFGSL